MLMNILKIICTLVLLIPFVRSALAENDESSKPHIAVYEFQVRGDLGIPDAGAIIAEWMIGALDETKRFTLMERVLLAHLIEEQDLQSSPLSDETKMASEAGKLYGVEAVVSGSVIQWDDTISIVARLVDTSTGRIRGTAEISSGNRKDIRDKIYDLARKLAGLEVGALPHDTDQVASTEYKMLLAVYPPRVITGAELEIKANVPPSCTPNFINISKSKKVTPIPLQFFKETILGKDWRRYETSPDSNSEYRIIVHEQDERGDNKLGFICEPTGGLQDKKSKINLLRDLSVKLFNGEMEGNLAVENSAAIPYRFSSYIID